MTSAPAYYSRPAASDELVDVWVRNYAFRPDSQIVVMLKQGAVPPPPPPPPAPAPLPPRFVCVPPPPGPVHAPPRSPPRRCEEMGGPTFTGTVRTRHHDGVAFGDRWILGYDALHDAPAFYYRDDQGRWMTVHRFLPPPGFPETVSL